MRQIFLNFLVLTIFILLGSHHINAQQPFTFEKCKDKIDAKDIPSTPLSGKFEGKDWKFSQGYVDYFKARNLNYLEFYGAPLKTECDSWPKESGAATLKFQATILNKVEKKTYIFNIKDRFTPNTKALFSFKRASYISGTSSEGGHQKSATLIIDNMSKKKGEKITGKVAICMDKDNYIAGTFEIVDCIAR